MANARNHGVTKEESAEILTHAAFYTCHILRRPLFTQAAFYTGRFLCRLAEGMGCLSHGKRGLDGGIIFLMIKSRTAKEEKTSAAARLLFPRATRQADMLACPFDYAVLKITFLYLSSADRITSPNTPHESTSPAPTLSIISGIGRLIPYP